MRNQCRPGSGSPSRTPVRLVDSADSGGSRRIAGAAKQLSDRRETPLCDRPAVSVAQTRWGTPPGHVPGALPVGADGRTSGCVLATREIYSEAVRRKTWMVRSSRPHHHLPKNPGIPAVSIAYEVGQTVDILINLIFEYSFFVFVAIAIFVGWKVQRMAKVTQTVKL